MHASFSLIEAVSLAALVRFSCCDIQVIVKESRISLPMSFPHLYTIRYQFQSPPTDRSD